MLVVQPYVQAAPPSLTGRLASFAAARAGDALGALGAAAGRAAAHVGEGLAARLPPVHLARVTLADSRLEVQVWGEPIPRLVEDIGATVRLAPGYSRFELDLEGAPRARDPRSVKCTMVAPTAKRHLRHVTPGTVPAGAAPLRAFTCDVLPAWLEASGNDDSSGAQADDAAAVQAEFADGEQQQQQQELTDQDGQPAHQASAQRLQRQQRQWSNAQLSGSESEERRSSEDREGAGDSGPAPYKRPEPLHLGPTGQAGLPHTVHFLAAPPPGEDALRPPAPGSGGRLRVRVSHSWPSDPGASMDLAVTVTGRGLHAPLIDRLLELPMDIHSGTVDGDFHLRATDPATWDFPAITGKLSAAGAPKLGCAAPGSWPR